MFDGLVWDMANPIYFSASLQVPASEVPNDYTVAKRLFTIERHGGMVLFRMGPVEGHDGESYSAPALRGPRVGDHRCTGGRAGQSGSIGLSRECCQPITAF